MKMMMSTVIEKTKNNKNNNITTTTTTTTAKTKTKTHAILSALNSRMAFFFSDRWKIIS